MTHITHFLKIFLFVLGGGFFYIIFIKIQPKSTDPISVDYILRLIIMTLIFSFGIKNVIKISNILFH